MRVVIQRVLSASVDVEGKTIASISKGLLLLCAFEASDNEQDLTWMTGKISRLRIFSDNEGKMNLSVMDIDGDVLAVSQFTLYASTKKGNRPSFVRSAPPEKAARLFENFCKMLSASVGKNVQTGIFGADMKVKLINDGPVTIIIDSKNKE